MPVDFLRRERKGVDLDGKGGWEELEEVDGKETVIRIFYVRIKAIFNKRKIILKHIVKLGQVAKAH